MLLEFLEGRVLLSRSWFVSLSGNDRAPGTVGAPLRTIQAAANDAQPGDTVIIRGGIYRETITLPRSGTPAAPITFEAYPGEQVVVSGADPLAGWSKVRNGVYQAPMQWDLGQGNNQVFVNGQMMNEARWPNSSLAVSRPSFAAVSSAWSTSPGDGWMFPATATITAANLPGPPGAWVGATIHIASGQEWLFQTGTVLSSSPGRLTFAFEHASSYEIPRAGNRFFLSGAPAAFDSAGEWYLDAATRRLYLAVPSGDAGGNLPVEARRRQFAFELSGRSWINVIGINLFSASIDTDAASSHLVLNGLYAQYVSQRTVNPIQWDEHDADPTGIRLEGSNQLLENSTIAFSSGNGVYVSGADNAVRNCTIHDVDYSANDSAGIQVTGVRQQIIGNTIHDAGRDGILDTNLVAGQILSNTIYNVGLQTTDLGGIYDWGTNGGQTVIAWNTIYNVHTGGFGGAGVYLDNGSSGFVVHDNVIWNCDHPIKVNPPAYNNTFYSNKTYGASVWDGGSATPGSFSPGVVGGVVDLGTLGGFRSVANGINVWGQAVGQSLTGHSSPAFVYGGGKSLSLGALGGSSSSAAAINNAGQIVGSFFTADGPRHAFLDSQGRMFDLGTLGGDVGSYAAAINSSGQIVGTSYNLGAIGHAFLYSGGRMTNVGTLGGAISMANGINDAGQIAGASTLPDNLNAHAFLDTNGTLRDLGTLGGASSYALAVNNRAEVVGESLVRGNGAVHAFLFSAGRMQDLGSLPALPNSVATAINSRGDIVGYAYSNDYFTYRAFLYRNGVMYDLNKLHANTRWTFQTANAINDNDQIAGGGVNPAGFDRGFVLSV